MNASADLALRLSRPPVEVAPLLLNAVLTHDSPEGATLVRITEVEAYGGADDPGSHAFRGQTSRNASMFGPPGLLYVYFTYGMHYCANVVVGAEGDPGAVLLRAGQVVGGVDLARRRRGSGQDRDLARGPARLCQALGLDRDHDAAHVCRGPITLTLDGAPPPARTGPRVGLRAAADRPWRFWIDGDPTVSPYRPASARRR